jgi:hypothetical protein
MYLSLISVLLTLTSFGKASAQAETLLGFVAETQPQMYSRRPQVTLDADGLLWVLADWGGDAYATRINPNGKLDIDKLLVHSTNKDLPDFTMGSTNACDRWGNLYCGVATVRRLPGTSANVISSIHLYRVTPDGDVKDYCPWPKIRQYKHHIEVLPGDTLVLVGTDYESSQLSAWEVDLRIAKALIDENGITPVYDKKYSYGNYPHKILRLPYDYWRNYYDWNRGYGFLPEIRVPYDSEGNESACNLLTIYRFDLRGSEHSITQDSLGTYAWRDYVWRTYKDAWIGWISFTKHKDGGYVLCIPDPKDRSITHLLRLDRNGEPVDSDNLESGGEKTPAKFDRRPTTINPLVDFKVWTSPAPGVNVRDSAHVLFWGCDEEGNLYAHRQFRSY